MDPDEAVVSGLMELGYSREVVLRALEASGNNPELAYDLLPDGSEDDSSDEVEPERYKLVFLVRTDLGMGTGKIAAQVGHASIGAYKQCPRAILDKWELSGQAKIVLQVESLEQMMVLKQCAESTGILTHHVEDAGRTQIEPGSITVCAIGPDADSKINEITGSLKLFK